MHKRAEVNFYKTWNRSDYRLRKNLAINIAIELGHCERYFIHGWLESCQHPRFILHMSNFSRLLRLAEDTERNNAETRLEKRVQKVVSARSPYLPVLRRDDWGHHYIVAVERKNQPVVWDYPGRV